MRDLGAILIFLLFLCRPTVALLCVEIRYYSMYVIFCSHFLEKETLANNQERSCDVLPQQKCLGSSTAEFWHSLVIYHTYSWSVSTSQLYKFLGLSQQWHLTWQKCLKGIIFYNLDLCMEKGWYARHKNTLLSWTV